MKLDNKAIAPLWVVSTPVCCGRKNTREPKAAVTPSGGNPEAIRHPQFGLNRGALRSLSVMIARTGKLGAVSLVLISVPACEKSERGADTEQSRTPNCRKLTRTLRETGGNSGSHARSELSSHQLDKALVSPVKVTEDQFEDLLRECIKDGRVDSIFELFLSVDPPYQENFSTALRIWGRLLGENGDDSKSTLGYLGKLTNRSPEAGNCVFTYVQAMTQSHEGKVLAAIKGVSALKSHQDHMLGWVARETGKNNPEKGLKLLDGMATDLALFESSLIMSHWIGQNPEEAIGFLSKATPAQLYGWMKNEGVTTKLAAVNPQMVAELCGKMPLTAENLKAVKSAAAVVGRYDKKVAYGMVIDLPKGQVRDNAVADLFASMATTAYERNVRELSEMAGDEFARRGIIRGLGQSSVETAICYVNSLKDGGSADENRELGRAVVLLDPSEAIKLLLNPVFREKIGDDYRGQYIDQAARGLASRNLKEATQWVSRLEGDEAVMGTRGLVTSWMKTDPVAAGEWLSALPSGPARDAGARVVIEQFKDTDPEMAEQWRKSLSQPAGGQK